MSKPLTKDDWIKIGQKMMEDHAKAVKIAKTRKFDTIATHGLYNMEKAFSGNSGSIMEPIYLTTAEAYVDSAHMEAALAYEMPTWCYSRIANPSNGFLEDTIALLESYDSDIEASCLATSSGMAAIRTATDAFLIKDDKLPKPNFVTSAKVYDGTFQQFSVRRYKEQGIDVRWIKNPYDLNEWKSQIDEGTRFVYGEFPSNPAVAIFDIEEVVKLAHKFGVPMIVDATCASPALTRPLLYGADIVIQSGTKVISTNGTSICGMLTSRKNIVSKVGCDEMKADFAVWAKLWPYRDNGPSISPINSILTLNDLRSLRMRISQMSDTGMKVATYLENHPKIDKVYYPGLKSYPAHEIAKKYMKLADTNENKYSYMMAMEIKEKAPMDSVNARKFYDALQMIWRATDLGRCKTVATLNAISTHQQQGEEGRKLAEIKPSTCRIAVGIEDADDIIRDLEQALAKI
ncbi:MAG TPA: aminotransferase class V-fold PLP-dependent enzyme [Bacteroidales bacterium]|nr:aminotransferase class V-fold PLP-dependent enzyme [Bacteroidales bacterium]HPS18155.1 aminotransferase class V-fold PLP-dependent enzyme [Bacteroidales bacterium]